MAWWDAPEGRLTHEVTIPCLCADPDFCVTARYIADVRIAVAEIEALRRRDEYALLSEGALRN